MEGRKKLRGGAGGACRSGLNRESEQNKRKKEMKQARHVKIAPKGA